MIGIIGGSGFYDFLDKPIKQDIQTPFGVAKVRLGKKEEKDVVFIPRHGQKHSILPSQINYRANIFAAYKLDVDAIYATNAVGSSDTECGPGSFVILDQIIDMSHGRKSTFFDGSQFSIELKSGKTLSGVVHTDVSEPFDNRVRKHLLKACEHLNEKARDGGTIVVFNGPRYETPAEIKAFTMIGGSYFGMTSSPEAFLAKELQIPYATLAVVTNFAAGLQKSINHNEVDQLFKNRIANVKSVLRYAISSKSTGKV